MFKTMRFVFAMVLMAAIFTGCTHLPGGTNLGAVAKDKGMVNITTGDGTFKDYKATGYHTGLEIGLGFGIPGVVKLMEVYPKQDNETQLGLLVDSAKENGANAVILVDPPKTTFTGIPFGIFGIYLDRTKGTGINVK